MVFESIKTSSVVCVVGNKVKRNKSDMSELTSLLRELQTTLQSNLQTIIDHTKSSCEQNIAWSDSVNTMATEMKVCHYTL